jgi:TetR/AcrR family transcriptional regulator, tetracycline repressor protein
MATQKRLNADDLITSALALADDEGLEAVTIRRLAQHHGVTPMALYRHFHDKEEILGALSERLLADIAIPEPNDEPWHRQMHDLLDAFLAALRPHPAVAQLPLTRVLASQPGLTVAERVLELLAQGGYTVEQAAEAAMQILCSLVALVMTGPDHGFDQDPEKRDEQLRAKKAHLAALSPRRYPNLVAAADALAYCADKDAYYAGSIARMVAGLRDAPRGPGASS